MIKILIGADIVPTTSNHKSFVRGNREALIGKDLNDVFETADYIIMNMEAPITDFINPIKKAGPNMSVSKNSLQGLLAINPYFYTLANNHILDQGKQGLLETAEILREHQISFAGAGLNEKEASKAFYKEIKGEKIGIYCCAEHEFTIASNYTAGANAYDPLYSFDHVKDMRKNCSYLIVLYHGGKEFYRYPSPQLRKIFRKFADVGADLVISQHTHCVGCKEEYNGATLVYGQGNFIFDGGDNEFWNSGILLEVNIDGDKRNIEYIPFQKKDGYIYKSNDEKILGGFTQRSNEILTEGFVEIQYSELAQKSLEYHLRTLSGIDNSNLVFRTINKLFFKHKLIFRKFTDKKLLAVQNLIECEAHRELLIDGIKNYIGREDTDEYLK